MDLRDTEEDFCSLMGADLRNYQPKTSLRGKQLFPVDFVEVTREYEDYFSISDALDSTLR